MTVVIANLDHMIQFGRYAGRLTMRQLLLSEKNHRRGYVIWMADNNVLCFLRPVDARYFSICVEEARKAYDPEGRAPVCCKCATVVAQERVRRESFAEQLLREGRAIRNMDHCLNGGTGFDTEEPLQPYMPRARARRRRHPDSFYHSSTREVNADDDRSMGGFDDISGNPGDYGDH